MIETTLLSRLTKGAIIILVLVAGGYWFFGQMLNAHEYEQCKSWESWARDGHPIVVPEWCDAVTKPGANTHQNLF